MTEVRAGAARAGPSVGAPSAPKPSSSDSTPGAGAGGSGSGLGTVTVKVAGLVVLDLETVPAAAPQFGESDTTRSTGAGARGAPQWRRPAHKAPFSRGAFAGPPCRLAAA